VASCRVHSLDRRSLILLLGAVTTTAWAMATAHQVAEEVTGRVDMQTVAV
jgi:hypothetical protein